MTVQFPPASAYSSRANPSAPGTRHVPSASPPGRTQPGEIPPPTTGTDPTFSGWGREPVVQVRRNGRWMTMPLSEAMELYEKQRGGGGNNGGDDDDWLKKLVAWCKKNLLGQDD